MHCSTGVDESLAQVYQHDEERKSAVFQILLGTVTDFEDFAVWNPVSVQRPYSCMHEMAGPKIVRVIVDLARERLARFVLLEFIWFQRHQLCLAAVTGPMRLSFELFCGLDCLRA